MEFFFRRAFGSGGDDEWRKKNSNFVFMNGERVDWAKKNWEYSSDVWQWKGNFAVIIRILSEVDEWTKCWRRLKLDIFSTTCFHAFSRVPWVELISKPFDYANSVSGQLIAPFQRCRDSYDKSQVNSIKVKLSFLHFLMFLSSLDSICSQTLQEGGNVRKRQDNANFLISIQTLYHHVSLDAYSSRSRAGLTATLMFVCTEN